MAEYTLVKKEYVDNTVADLPFKAFTSRAEAEASTIPLPVQYITIDGLVFKRDTSGTALITVGAKWSPANEITSKHFGTPLNGVDDDAPAIQAAIEYAMSVNSKKVIINGVITISNIELPGNMEVVFEGPQKAINTSGFTITILQDGTVQRNSVIRGIMLSGNDTADGGILCTASQYFSFYDPVIEGYSKPGAWAFVFSGNESNQNASSNQIFNPNFANCNNLLKMGKNPAIVGSQNTGASFNTIYGGYLGPFGDNTDNIQYGVFIEVGEGNKAFNTRVSTNKHHTRCWMNMDARNQLIGCAGDGPCFTAFVYPLGGGTGTVNSITLLGTPLLSTPVAWAGTRTATSEAIVAQIVAEGNQYPSTEFLSLVHDEQVMFFRIDGDGNKVRLTTPEISQITVTSTGLDVGHSGINLGLLQGPAYNDYPDITVNEWGYRAGHGGVMDVYGFLIGDNPEGSGRGGGSLYEPEGNGPRHIVWFENDVNQRSTNVIQAGSTVHGGDFISSDAVFTSLDNIQAVTTTGNVSIAHGTQRLRIQNFGPMVFAEIFLTFTPTITTNGQLYFEMPQLPGVYNTSETLDVTGLRYVLPTTISGLTTTETAYLVIFGGALSPNGHPYGRLMSSSGTIISTSSMTTGQLVTLQAWGSWPVNRF